MPYTLLYHPSVTKEDLPKIPKNIKDRIENVIENRLLKEPVLTGKPLRLSLKGHRKLRVGDYRIIYRLSENKIIILKIGHRKDVYLKITPRINYP
jgi:mRNA interferase RelE/StbE